jgi:iron complex outermembrane recepter protein
MIKALNPSITACQRFVLLLIFTFLVTSQATKAEGTSGTITGIVKTADGQPAAFVNVGLKGLNKGAVTDEQGRFIIKNVKEGTYIVTTSFVGMQSQEKTVTITADQVLTIDFTLTESAQQLTEIVISGTQSANEKELGIGKAGIKAFDLPQSVAVIDRVVLERQQALHLSDVLMNTNGVYVMGTTGGTQEEIAGRGFSFSGNNGVSNTFKNGARYNNAVMPEISSLEKVEILKGSNAILFGNVAPGGVLNLVTKKPMFQSGGEVSMRVGSYDLYKPSLDVYGSVNNSDKVAYRVTSSYENANSFRDEVSSERIYFNPSLLIRAGNKTEVLVEGDYLHDNRTQDFGTGAINYEIIDIPRNFFLGAPWSYFNATQKSATLTVTHTLNDSWQLKGSGSYQGYSSDVYGTTRPNASSNFVQTNGDWVRGLQRSGLNQDYVVVQLDATARFKTGKIMHTVLIGADADQYDNQTLAYAYANPLVTGKNKNVYDTINVFDANAFTRRSDIPTIDRNTLTDNPVDRAGVYVQDLVEVTDRWKILAGIRYSYLESESNVLKYADNTITPSAFYADAFTPRFGLVYQPIKAVSLFASYANSFNLNTGIDVNRNPLPPSYIDQYELGAKSDLLRGLATANITAYTIINSNLAQAVIGDPNNAQELAGEVTSKGVEVDITSKPIRGASFMVGYSYNDTRYTKSTQYIVGSKLRYNPAHTANASVYYNISKGMLKGMNFGVIGFYMGDRVAGRSTQVTTPNDTRKLMPVPGFLQFDVSAGYSFNSISLRLKVTNLLNELSYHVHDDNSVNPIAPRQWAATVSYKL